MKKFLIILILLVGCSSDNNKHIKNNINSVNIYDDKISIYKNKKNYSNENLNNIEKFELKNKSISKREEEIKFKIKQISKIQNCNVNIVGNIAVVTIQTFGNLNDENLISTKKEVEIQVKKIDTSIDHVTVNASAEFFEQAKNNIDIEEKNVKPETNNLTHELMEEIIPNL